MVGSSEHLGSVRLDTGPYDTTGRIFKVLAVHHGTGSFSACCDEPSCPALTAPKSDFSLPPKADQLGHRTRTENCRSDVVVN
jgi:hypothetical protein